MELADKRGFLIMSFVNIISAVGNNSSVCPLIVRDCGIEIPVKTAITYNQNLKVSQNMANNALRERLIDEYGTSAVWLGGIPLLDKLCNFFIKKLGYNPEINPKLYKETERQGLKYNINKFKKSSPEIVKDLEKVLKNKRTYESLLASKFVISTAIPIFLMGFFLPKANFKLTEKLNTKTNSDISKERNNNLTFKGATTTLANMTTVKKMAVTDGGLTVGRVTTARNKFEKLELAYKMLGMMVLNYIAPIWISKLLDKISDKIFKTNVDLDPKILADKNFINEVKRGKFELPNDNIIDFLDKNPNKMFSQMANKYVGKNKYLKNGTRNPLAYIDEEKVISFKNELCKFISQANKSKDVKKFANKALKIKSGNIIANVLISSFLLAIALPVSTFKLRKIITGSDAEPGLVKKES